MSALHQLTKVTTLSSSIGKELVYFKSREKQLSVFLNDGMVEIDTNIMENTIRPIAFGRNNYMFCGSHQAAQNAAINYSLIETCKLHGINAYDWLKMCKHRHANVPSQPDQRIPAAGLESANR